MKNIAIKRAIISVSDKTNLVDFAKALVAHGVEILSTGGTQKMLASEGIPVSPIESYTQFPEMMDGRVKTLHPKVHGSLLGRLHTDSEVMQANAIQTTDLLIVNLYPFAQTIAQESCTYDMAIENIDIGGPAMLRSGAKNHERVTVVCDPVDYAEVLQEIKTQHGGVSYSLRKKLAAKVYTHTAQYDAQIANYLSQQELDDNEKKEGSGDLLFFAAEKQQSLRYGENPHQQASVYRLLTNKEHGVATAPLIQGKPLSYNNLVDAEAAVANVFEFEDPSCVIVKHANPCGVATSSDTLLSAYDKAYACDPTSAFGGIIAFNHHLDKLTAEAIIKRQFVEVIVAPSIDSDALQILSEKPNVRVLALGENYQHPKTMQMLRRVSGGLLVQSSDCLMTEYDGFKVVTEREPSPSELHDLLFSWKVVKHVKSNAIVFAKGLQTVGVGCGQTSRIHSTMIAAIKASEQSLETQGSVLASDAFFPFRDGIDEAAKHGVKAVIQPGGSMRDEEVIKAANEHGIAMIFTGVRHFNH